MNPKYWDKPEKFNPRRFLSEDGKTVTWPPALIPFGMGEIIENYQRLITGIKLAPVFSCVTC